MVQNLSRKLLDILVEYEEISTTNLALMLDISKKRLWYEIDQVNEVLEYIGKPPLIFHDGFIINKSVNAASFEMLHSDITSTNTIPKSKRYAVIVLFILTNNGWTAISHLQEICALSKNTILSELKKIRVQLSTKGLMLNYSRKEGYTISGDAWSVRREMEQSIVDLCSFTQGDQIIETINNIAQYCFTPHDIADYILTISKNYSIKFVTERLYEASYMLSSLMMLKDAKPVVYDFEAQQYFKQHPLYPLACDICKKYGITYEQDAIYITTRLMAAIQGSQNTVLEPNFMNLTREIIDRMNAMTLGGLEHVQPEVLFEKLYEHLVPSYYRIKYQLPLSETYTEKTKHNYPKLFHLVSQALTPLSHETQSEISDHEIAYFTMHFGGYLKTSVPHHRQYKALIICSSGVSSLIQLKSQLTRIFPEVNFVGSHTYQDIDSIDTHDIDMIFSTISFETPIALFITKPIMSWVEEEILKKKVKDQFSMMYLETADTIDNILRTVSKYVNISDKENLSRDLVKALYHSRFETDRNHLSDIFKEDFIQVSTHALSWNETLILAAKPLVDHGYITQNDVHEMMIKHEKTGVYISPNVNVAFLYVRNDTPQKELGMSLLVLNASIHFTELSQDQPIQLLFVLSAPIPTHYLTAIQNLYYFLETKDTIERIQKMKQRHELYQFVIQHQH